MARGVQVLLSFALLKSYDDDVKAYETLEVSLTWLRKERGRRADQYRFSRTSKNALNASFL